MTSVDPITGEQPMKFIAEIEDATLCSTVVEDILVIEVVEPEEDFRQRRFNVLFASNGEELEEWEHHPAVYQITFTEDDISAVVRCLVMVPLEEADEDWNVYREDWYEFYAKEVVVNNGWYRDRQAG